MAVYPQKVNARFLLPRFAARPQAANSAGTSASFVCGSFVRMSIAVESGTKTIAHAGFQANGCGFMIAAADVIAESLIGSELTGLHGVDEAEFFRVVEAEIGELPPNRAQCVHVVLEALREAFADYRAYLIEEFKGEKPLICTCFGVAEENIERFISANKPATVDEVTAACRAGGGCGSCRMIIQEMIDSHALVFQE